MTEQGSKARSALRTGLRLAGWWLLYFVVIVLTVTPASAAGLALAAAGALGIAYLSAKRRWDFWWS